MKKVKISVVTITYNALPWLERTIRSVLAQKDSEVEYLIIDGGSGDGTVELIRRYESCLARWISEPDKGLYDAMNKGLRLATGDYIVFLNAGDTFRDENCLSGISKIAVENALPDILYGETDLVDADGKYLGPRRLKAPEHLSWRSFRMGMLVCHQAFIVKRDKAPEYDLSYRFSADYDWCIRCMKLAGSIVNTHLRLVNYLYEGLSTQNRKISLKERYRIMEKYYGKFPVFVLHIWFAFRFYLAKLTRKAV